MYTPTHTARNAMPGVAVAPALRDRPQGLNPGQTKAMRKTNLTTPQHKIATPYTLGMLPAAKSAYSQHQTIATRPVYKHRTPGKKFYSGRCSSAPVNTVFQGKVPTSVQRETSTSTAALEALLVEYRTLMLDMTASEDAYESRRTQFLAVYAHTHKHLLEKREREIAFAVS